MSRTSKWAVCIIALIFAPFAFLVVRSVITYREFVSLKDGLRQSIDALKDRRPNDVSDQQWNCAIEWSGNLISQVLLKPNDRDIGCLRRLNRQFAERTQGVVDLKTLQWFWDQMADCETDRISYAIRFRDVRLLVREPINDETLPDLWSINRATHIDLSQTKVTDASVPFLSELKHLEYLNIGETAISDEGLQELQTALPKCKVGRVPSGLWFPLFP